MGKLILLLRKLLFLMASLSFEKFVEAMVERRFENKVREPEF